MKVFGAEPRLSEFARSQSVERFAGKYVDVYSSQEIERMNDNRARQNKAHRRRTFCVRQRLLLFGRNTNVIPEVNLAFFHLYQFAELRKELIYTSPIESGGVT